MLHYTFKEIDLKLADMEKNVKELVQVTTETRKEADEAREEAQKLRWEIERRRRAANKVFEIINIEM